MRDPRERLRDMLEAIEHIERYASRGRDAFERDELIQVWIVHHLEVIGEAVVHLGRNFHDVHPEVPWLQIVAIRRMFQRRISDKEVRHVIETGETIETYPEDSPYPSRLVLGWYGSRPLMWLSRTMSWIRKPS